jgi:hypothetical protein
MFPFRGFFAGYAVGFASGVVFRVMAEKDFEPAKDVFKTAVGIAQKAGDAVAETFGRFVENLEDLRSQARAERVPRGSTVRAAEPAIDSGTGPLQAKVDATTVTVSETRRRPRAERKRPQRRVRTKNRSRELNA